MGLFDDIKPVPFRLLDELQAQMEANRERINIQQELKGLTRPRSQRSIFNATMSDYRRPEPAAHVRRRGDLDVFWLYFGGDGRLWIRSATGAGGWQYVNTWFGAFGGVQADTLNQEEIFTYAEQNTEFFQSHVDWSVQPKAWSPEYGGKGRYGDWYDFRRTDNLSFAIKQADGGGRELYVDFPEFGNSLLEDEINIQWCSTGRGSVTALAHLYMANAGFAANYVRITEQAPGEDVKYWAYTIAQSSVGPTAQNEYYLHSYSPNGLNTRLTTRETTDFGVASAFLDEGQYTVGLTPAVYFLRRQGEEPDPVLCPPGTTETSYGGNTCPFDQDPPTFTWAEFGWPETKFAESPTLKATYEAVNPFTLFSWQNFYVTNQDEETEANIRAIGALTGGGPYSFAVAGARITSPFAGGSEPGYLRGFDLNSFFAWYNAFVGSGPNYRPSLGIRWATPSHINYLLGQNAASQSQLSVPEWEWMPNILSGAFSLDLAPILGESEDGASQVREAMTALMNAGSFNFLRSDGRKESVAVGGGNIPFPEDSDTFTAFGQILFSSKWDQHREVKDLADQLGLT